MRGCFLFIGSENNHCVCCRRNVAGRNRVSGAQLEGSGGLFGMCSCDEIFTAVVVVVVVVVDDDDHFYVALFSALEQNHCASIRFCMRD